MIASYVNVEGSYREAGKASDMLNDVMAKTVTAEMKERKVFVFAHNMRGFDSSFILQLLYDKGYKVISVRKYDFSGFARGVILQSTRSGELSDNWSRCVLQYWHAFGTVAGNI